MNLELELPELFDIDWNNFSVKIDDLYDIYLNEIYGKLSIFGKPVQCRETPMDGNKHNCFWHLITQDLEKKKRNSERYPDIHRCKRIKWISYIIQHYNSNDIICWEKLHWRKCQKKTVRENRIFLWAKDVNFIVVLGQQRKPTGYQLITSYCTNDPNTINKLEKQSKEYPDPRKIVFPKK